MTTRADQPSLRILLVDMGLEDLVPEDDEDKEGHCIECGKRGEETDRWYYRCTNEDCGVLTWIETSYELGIEV